MVTMLPKRYEESGCRPPAGPPPQLMLVGAPESVRVARAYAREFIAYHLPDLAPDHADNVELVVSELVTNAVRYGTEPGDCLLVELFGVAARVRIEVRDPVRRRPSFKPASHERDRGRGLFIVEALAECWGVVDQPFGKTVWAVVAR
ncbi:MULTISPECIES: ATP-binding protein [unclassified Streptomyces]|uniref:ATP-binding protein n=1 Tax=unclassified Streptomyces TaxID=2593676 RepID=UPI003428E51C